MNCEYVAEVVRVEELPIQTIRGRVALADDRELQRGGPPGSVTPPEIIALSFLESFSGNLPIDTHYRVPVLF